MLPKLVVEGIGTFFLVFTIGMVVIEPGAGPLAPLAIGSALMVMIFAGGPVSGGHYNPAVTLGVFMRGLTSRVELFGYWVAQLVGAALAVFSVRTLKGDVAVTAMQLNTTAAMLAEFLFTFALVWVVLHVATAAGNKGNSHYGLAIGFTVMTGAFAVGSVSGGAFNPAVAVGIAMMGLVDYGSLWIYFVANLLGGAVAAVVFNAFDMGSDKPTTAKQEDQPTLRAPADTRAVR